MSKFTRLVADSLAVATTVFAFSKRLHLVFFEVHPRAVDDHLDSSVVLSLFNGGLSVGLSRGLPSLTK